MDAGHGAWRADNERFCFCQRRRIREKKDFEYWINLALDFNGKAKASKKKLKYYIIDKPGTDQPSVPG